MRRRRRYGTLIRLTTVRTQRGIQRRFAFRATVDIVIVIVIIIIIGSRSGSGVGSVVVVVAVEQGSITGPDLMIVVNPVDGNVIIVITVGS